MCKIRVIFKSDTGEIKKDSEMEFVGIDMNQIDRPSYIEVVLSNDEINIRFEYYNDQEQYRTYTYHDLKFDYAILSGRIRTVQGETMTLHDTDKYHILQGLSSLDNQRFKINSSAYISIVMRLLNETMIIQNKEQ